MVNLGSGGITDISRFIYLYSVIRGKSLGLNDVQVAELAASVEISPVEQNDALQKAFNLEPVRYNRSIELKLPEGVQTLKPAADGIDHMSRLKSILHMPGPIEKLTLTQVFEDPQPWYREEDAEHPHNHIRYKDIDIMHDVEGAGNKKTDSIRVDTTKLSLIFKLFENRAPEYLADTEAFLAKSNIKA